MIQFEQPLTGDIEFGRLLIRQLHHLKKHLTHPLEIPDTAQTDPLILQIVQLALAQLLRLARRRFARSHSGGCGENCSR